MKEIVKNISNRQIAIRSGVDQRTVSKFFNNKNVLFVKEQKIKKAILEIVKEAKKIEKELNR